MQTFKLKDAQYDVGHRSFFGRGLELMSKTLESLEMSGLEASVSLYSILSYHALYFPVIVNSSRSAEAPCSSETPVQLGPLVHLRPLTPCSAVTPRSFETPDSLFSWEPSFI